MAFIDAMTRAARSVLLEINKASHAEGLPDSDLTGKVWMDLGSEAVWFQVEDAQHTTTWASADFPEYAAPGETVVVAADENDMRNFDANRQPPATYRVVGTDVEGLEPDEVLYSGLTRDEAFATADGCRDLAEPGKYNFTVTRDPRP